MLSYYKNTQNRTDWLHWNYCQITIDLDALTSAHWVTCKRRGQYILKEFFHQKCLCNSSVFFKNYVISYSRCIWPTYWWYLDYVCKIEHTECIRTTDLHARSVLWVWNNRREQKILKASFFLRNVYVIFYFCLCYIYLFFFYINSIAFDALIGDMRILKIST